MCIKDFPVTTTVERVSEVLCTETSAVSMKEKSVSAIIHMQTLKTK